MERLDEKYGRPNKVAGLILNVIRKQPVTKEGDDKNLINFVNIIENGFWGLERRGMRAETSNSVLLSLVEEKLLKNIKHGNRNE